MCEVTDHVHVFRCMQPGQTYIRDTVVTATSDLTSFTENFKGGWGGGGFTMMLSNISTHTHTQKPLTASFWRKDFCCCVIYIIYR